MTRSRASAKHAVLCQECGQTRWLKYPDMAGWMCRICAQKIAARAAATSNTSSTLEKFEQYVRRTDGCWEWTGHCYGNGYAAITHDRHQMLAHRWSYEHFVGHIPDGLTIDHLCRNRRCVRPDHLEPVTSGENTRRAMRNTCIKGHPFDEANTWTYRGKRYCRTCRRDRNRARRNHATI